jgi:hypothetical protein
MSDIKIDVSAVPRVFLTGSARNKSYRLLVAALPRVYFSLQAPQQLDQAPDEAIL